jgi:ribosomal protein S18 acetylase RimI-like enzyme
VPAPTAPPVAGPYTARALDWDDLPRLAAAGRGSPHPLTYDDLAKVIESRYGLGVVAVSPDRHPVGVAVYSVSDGTGRATSRAGRLHINAGVTAVQVDPAWRRRGVGRFMLDTLAAGLVRRFSADAAAGRVRLYSVVPESWTGALCFYRAAGFRVPPDRARAFRAAPFTHCPDDGVLTERFAEWPAAPSAAPALSAPAAAEGA